MSLLLKLHLNTPPSSNSTGESLRGKSFCLKVGDENRSISSLSSDVRVAGASAGDEPLVQEAFLYENEDLHIISTSLLLLLSLNKVTGMLNVPGKNKHCGKTL